MRTAIVALAVACTCAGAGVTLAAATAAGADPGRPGAGVAGCATSSLGRFGTGSPERDLVAGPLRLSGARGYGRSARPAWFKMPALVDLGHRATIRIAPAARGVVRFRGYGRHVAVDPRSEVTFVACTRGHERSSRRGSRRVTFWSGGFEADRPICLPLDVRVDRERRWRRVVVSLGAGAC